ncbi:rRNA N6-adenosine-methyltransferase METTL5 isoform X2 [Mangifera indica]|uniref:rRNA N6-adenosine-methyltransferase METTL5 isoform X2 n=1 Tax=Mangifera indica TaxID=29780 RepID=UPI001CFC1CD9|nr:rRNA N6-adenosine-methyltransferase METTL5 isoform X2 [Mangifera indica]
MKLKQLESLLGDLEQFSNPKVELEQYPTGPHIAARMLYTAENSFGDVTNKLVADFGCGCGTLGAAAALLDAEQVVAIDIDPHCLETASRNAEDLELDINFIQGDIRNLEWRGQTVDTVVMNPPFGTRKKGADMDFLSVALKVASGAVYSLHKTSTRDLRYDVPQLYKFHKKKEVDIAVDLWRFVPKRNQRKVT